MSDPSWVNREEAKKILGVTSDAALVKILGKYTVRQRKAKRAYWYPKGDILRVARTEAAHRADLEALGVEETTRPKADVIKAGQITARAFKLFGNNTDLVAVAIELEITGEEVEELFLTWWRLNQRSQEWLRGPEQHKQLEQRGPTEYHISNDVGASTALGEELPSTPLPEISVATVSTGPCAAPRDDGMCCPKHFLAKKKVS